MSLSNGAAEWAVVASLIRDSRRAAEVIGTQLEPSDFAAPDAHLLYRSVLDAYYADATIEPLSIAERVRRPLTDLWGGDEADVGELLLARLSQRDLSANVLDHVEIVKRLSVARRLLSVAKAASEALESGELTPEEVAGTMSTDALGVISGTARRSQISDWMEVGTTYAKYLRRQRIAREQGIDVAVYTGHKFIDDYTKGLAPSELCFLGGAPGTGKSIVAWKCAEGFASRQMTKARPEDRVGTLVVSMEMGEIPSTTRLAQSITKIDGMRLREGLINDGEYAHVLREWKARAGLPIWFNFASNFRLSQLRALIVEGIRRYNIGFVVLDHFRMIDPDKTMREVEADEAKVRFLKESIAKDLNVAVLCLAHTIKLGRASEGAGVRPRLSDLRGSGQIAANADFVGLLYRPSRNLTDEEQMSLNVHKDDAELLWVKGRHTNEGVAYFTIDASTMSVALR